MGRKKTKNVVSARKVMEIKECYENDQSTTHDVNSGDENEASIDDDQMSSKEKSAMDSFYEKLIKLNESSGLSLVFNFRETKLDLFLVYKEVIERGGSLQVSKAGKWSEVASALSIKDHDSILPSQIQKVYENLLCQYEQIHYYRTPAKVSGYSSHCLGMKRKFFDSSSEDDQAEKMEFAAHTCQVPKRGRGRPKKNPTLQTSSDKKTIIRDPRAPLRARTSYQMFLKLECERLKKIHGESSGSLNLRDVATDAWRHLSKDDRLPYAEASRKDKDRFNTEMAVHNQHKNKMVAMTENLLSGSTSALNNLGTSSPINGEYYVTLEVNAGNFHLPDESLVESTIQVLKNAQPDDPIFQMNWDGCCGSPDSSS